MGFYVGKGGLMVRCGIQDKVDKIPTGLARYVIALAALVGAVITVDVAEAVDSGKLIEKDGQHVFVESQDPAVKLLLERSLNKGLITQDEYDRVLKESETHAYLNKPSFNAWYDRGFNISTNDNAFLLKIRGLVQMRSTQRFRNNAWRTDGDGANFPELLGVFGDYRANRAQSDSTGFNLRRVRLAFMGHLFSPDFQYMVQLRAETAENAQSPGSAQLADYYVTSRHLPWANLQVGQYKVYFNRAQINSTASMQFPERALVMDAFTASGLDRRDMGITFLNDEELYPVNYYFGVFNGAGPSFNRIGAFTSEEPTNNCPGGAVSGNPYPSPQNCPSSQRDLNANLRTNINQLMYTARLMWNVMGRPGYGEGDIAYSEMPQMAIGGGYSYNPAINANSNQGYVGIDLANLTFRRQLAAFGNARQLGWGVLDFSTWNLDYVFKYRGFSLQAEYYFKNVTRHDKGLPCMVGGTTGSPTCTARAPGLLGNATGWYVQSGYYLIPRKVEAAARFAYWDPDTHSGGDLVKEVDVSLNWFLNDTYDHSIMLEYYNVQMGTGGYLLGRSNPLPSVSGAVALDSRGPLLIENGIRLQYQIFF
ncbi:MAG: hypothetical protein KGO52_06320 [Nitrospirota bacterium]|nr:hypothetical protein [Nitrospirota bacterium]